MKIVVCAACGVEFGLSDEICARRKEDGQTFHCPNGHGNMFGVSEIKELKRKVKEKDETIQRLRRRVDELHDQVVYWRAAANGYKGQWRKAIKQGQFEIEAKDVPAVEMGEGEGEE